MKKVYKILWLFCLTIFSFYYTEKIALIMQSKSNLMQEIEKSSNNSIKSVSAIIDGNTIIPGLNGLEVDKQSSFAKMKDLGIFNSYYLVYKEVPPTISLKDNKDKIIIRGNKAKKSVSLILESYNELANYLQQNNLKASILIKLKNYLKSDYFELINNEWDNFETIERLLNSNNINKNICVINDYNYNICQKKDKFLVKPTYSINNHNLINYKSNITSGDIILIDNNMSLDNLKILLKEIQYRDLKIIYLSEMISENNNGA